MQVKVTEAPTFWARIYIAGNRADAERTCRFVAFRDGACVTVTPTEYIYSGGQESGVIVGLINYPRFPASQEEITENAEALAVLLADALHQKSYSIETPATTRWFTRSMPFEVVRV